mmetsp:Transcript_26819/g.40366  ORF Transcript_26819/g.40366 Transcript_26819/m.40366 type:complete len:516 (+) Transcript_26819:321-1868(+)
MSEQPTGARGLPMREGELRYGCDARLEVVSSTPWVEVDSWTLAFDEWRRRMANGPHVRRLVVLVFVILVFLRLFEPRDEGLRGLAHFPAKLLLRPLVKPLDDGLLLEDVHVIQDLQNDRRLLEESLCIRRLADKLLHKGEQLLLRLSLVGGGLEELDEKLLLRLQLLDRILVEVGLKDEPKQISRLQFVLLGDGHQGLDAVVDRLLLHCLLHSLADALLLHLELIHADLLHLLLYLLERLLLLLHPSSHRLRGSVHAPVIVIFVSIVWRGRWHCRLLFLRLFFLLLLVAERLVLLDFLLFLLVFLRETCASNLDASLGIRRVVEDVRRQLVTHVRKAVMATCLAVKVDVLLLDLHRRLWQLATWAQHPLADELVRLLLEHRCLMPASDRTGSLIRVEASHIRTKLDRTVFCEVLWGALQRLGNIRRVREHGALSIPAPLQLPHHGGHLVAIRGVIATADIEVRHDNAIFLLLVRRPQACLLSAGAPARPSPPSLLRVVERVSGRRVLQAARVSVW